MQISTAVRHAAGPAFVLLRLQRGMPLACRYAHAALALDHHQSALYAVYVAVSGLACAGWPLLRTVLQHYLWWRQHVLNCACKGIQQLADDGGSIPLAGATLLGRHMFPEVQEGSQGLTSRQALLRFVLQMSDADPIAVELQSCSAEYLESCRRESAAFCPASPG